MSRKQLYKQRKIFNPAVWISLELPGDPLIYSIKQKVGKRKLEGAHFRNIKFSSIIKCYFKAYYNVMTPCVLIVTFYVAPPSHAKVSAEALKKEATPAVLAYEACDYLLSFMEMLLRKLVWSYKQLVKIDVTKIYSANPRTVFQFMTWENYGYLQSNNTIQTETKSIGTPEQQEEMLVQSKLRRDVETKKLHQEQIAGFRRKKAALRASTIDSALPNPSIDGVQALEATKHGDATAHNAT